MKDEILSLESDFANNEYFGTNVWTEEKYRVLSGNTPVLISAPHSVNQLRGDDVRDAEKFTGSLARYLSSATGSYAIFQLFTHADPNFDYDHNYKNGIINLVEVNNIKLLIDIHSSTFKDDTDIDIVTDNRITLLGNSNIIDSLKEIAIKNNVKVDENNIPNKDKENEIISVVSLICGIPTLRLVINNKKLNLDNIDSFTNIVNTIKEFIINYK